MASLCAAALALSLVLVTKIGTMAPFSYLVEDTVQMIAFGEGESSLAPMSVSCDDTQHRRVFLPLMENFRILRVLCFYHVWV